MSLVYQQSMFHSLLDLMEAKCKAIEQAFMTTLECPKSRVFLSLETDGSQLTVLMSSKA